MPRSPNRSPARPIGPWGKIRRPEIEKWAIPELEKECQADLNFQRKPSPQEFHDWIVWLIDNRPDYNT